MDRRPRICPGFRRLRVLDSGRARLGGTRGGGPLRERGGGRALLSPPGGLPRSPVRSVGHRHASREPHRGGRAPGAGRSRSAVPPSGRDDGRARTRSCSPPTPCCASGFYRRRIGAEAPGEAGRRSVRPGRGGWADPTPADADDRERGNGSDAILPPAPITHSVGDHRPTLQGAEVDLAAYSEVDRRGVLANGLACWSPTVTNCSPKTGPLARFAATPVRLLVRKTLAYSNLAFEGQHPYLSAMPWIATATSTICGRRCWRRLHLERLIAAEHRDMERGRHPMFTASPVSIGRVDERRREDRGIPERHAFERVRERLRGLDEAEDRAPGLDRVATLSGR